jgi:hypothetical protein
MLPPWGSLAQQECRIVIIIIMPMELWMALLVLPSFLLQQEEGHTFTTHFKARLESQALLPPVEDSMLGICKLHSSSSSVVTTTLQLAYMNIIWSRERK